VGAALALAILLVVVVGGLSLAVNSQGPLQGPRPAPQPRSARPVHPGRPKPAKPAQPGEPKRRRADKDAGDLAKRLLRGRARATSEDAPDRPIERPFEQPPLEPEQVFGDLKPLSTQGKAIVVSVVDERTLGPVTRSRLTLKVQPEEGENFEVTTRVAFPTPEARARVKVGSTIPVRYDPADHRRVVVEVETGGEG